MSFYVVCPRPKCDGELVYGIASDSDDVRSWVQAEPEQDHCTGTTPHEITADEWDALSEQADKLANEAAYDGEPAGLSA